MPNIFHCAPPTTNSKIKELGKTDGVGVEKMQNLKEHTHTTHTHHTHTHREKTFQTSKTEKKILGTTVLPTRTSARQRYFPLESVGSNNKCNLEREELKKNQNLKCTFSIWYVNGRH